MGQLLEPEALGEHLGAFRHHLFRMETLPEYAVDSDGDDYQRWLDGAPEPTWERLGRWLDILRAEHAAGKISTRVRILTADLTDYERYACEFGYRYTVEAGEDIRVLRRAEHPIPPDIVERDFWIVDDARVIAMHYDQYGRFEGGEILDDDELEPHLRTRRAAWQVAEPFATWWARHPELHRRQAA